MIHSLLLSLLEIYPVFPAMNNQLTGLSLPNVGDEKQFDLET